MRNLTRNPLLPKLFLLHPRRILRLFVQVEALVLVEVDNVFLEAGRAVMDFLSAQSWMLSFRIMLMPMDGKAIVEKDLSVSMLFAAQSELPISLDICKVKAA
jgi:hypothetical protein